MKTIDYTQTIRLQKITFREMHANRKARVAAKRAGKPFVAEPLTVEKMGYTANEILALLS